MTGSGAREPFVGRAIARREDARLLTGAGEFVDDLPADDVLHVAFVRSPHASARIEPVDLEAAREAPGVVSVVDGTALGLGPLCTPITAPSSTRPPPSWNSRNFEAAAPRPRRPNPPTRKYAGISVASKTT